ncbi:MAG TPA: ABC transporter substrate-binding protein [Egibacteraceae bacterium]
MRRVIALLGALALTLTLTSCGADSGAGTATTSEAAPSEPAAAATAPTAAATPSEDAFPVTVEAANGAVEISERPERIVSLSPTTTEMLFAVGAGDQVVAVEENSDYPEGVPVTDLSGFDPNLEAIVAYEPDLVVLTDDTNDILAGLEQVGVPALHTPAAQTLEDVYDQLEQVGMATGHFDEARALVEDMRAEIDELVARVPEEARGATYYHELDAQLFTATSDTFVGEIYALAGLENVADPADADGQAAGYPQLSAEFLVDADPDMVFLADTKCCGESAETFAARPGFASMTAVERGHVFPLDDDVASRWGPRVVDFLGAIVDAAEQFAADGGAR